jgi:glycosyltransferase involved in cell wall biosynthesis
MSSDRAAPLVSIVIPAYNREHHLARTLDSVVAQTLTRWELVVSDDGSTDGTKDIAHRFADEDARIRVLSGPNGGVASARNRGFAATDPGTSFVTFLDSDDLWERDTLEVLVGMLDSHPEYVAAYGVASCIDDDDQPIPGDDLSARMVERRGLRDGRLASIGPDEPTTFSEMVFENWVFTPGLCLSRRPITQRVGAYDPSVDPADDWDLNIRISRLGDIGFIDRPVLRWRRHPNTLTNTSDRWKRAHYGVRRKTLTDPTNTPEQTRAVLACYRLDFESNLATARELACRRDVRGTARQATKVADRLARRVRAQLTARMFV